MSYQWICQFAPAETWLLSHIRRTIWATLLEMYTVCPWGNEGFKCQNKCTVLQFKVYTELFWISHPCLFVCFVFWKLQWSFYWWTFVKNSNRNLLSTLSLHSLKTPQMLDLFTLQDFCSQLNVLDNVTVRKYANRVEREERYRWEDSRKEGKYSLFLNEKRGIDDFIIFDW